MRVGWDSVRPWACDDVIKSHFIQERNLELGTVEVKRMRMTQNVNAENKWFSNNVNERQRLLNTMTRGFQRHDWRVPGESSPIIT